MLKHFEVCRNAELNDLFKSHKAIVQEFCDNTSLQDASVYSFMPFYADRQLLVMDKIEFVVDWNKEKCFGLALALVKKVFSNLAGWLTIHSLSLDTCSVSLLCFVPQSLHQLLWRFISKNEADFFKENPNIFSIQFGGGVAIEQKCEEEVSRKITEQSQILFN